MTHQTRVLVLTKDTDAAQNLERILREAGFAVTHEPSADEPGFSISEDVFDVIISDIGEPDQSALEAAARLCSDHPLSPVIIMADRADEETAAQASVAGAAGFIGKPVSVRSIGSAMIRALKARVEVLWGDADHLDETWGFTQTAEEPAGGMSQVMGFLGNMALFLAAPFVALSYSLALPFVGFYVIVKRIFTGDGKETADV
jgi:DNA-binding NtrC family response regulator